MEYSVKAILFNSYSVASPSKPASPSGRHRLHQLSSNSASSIFFTLKNLKNMGITLEELVNPSKVTLRRDALVSVG